MSKEKNDELQTLLAGFSETEFSEFIRKLLANRCKALRKKKAAQLSPMYLGFKRN